MRKRGAISAQVEIRVPFFDIDSLNVVWHGHYVKYLEQARCELLDQLGHNYDAMRASGYAWPVIDLHLRYAQPAEFGQRLTVRAELVEWENRLKINYLILDTASGKRLTRGSSEQVAVSIETREMQLVSPPVFVDAVQRKLQALEASA
ncbi:MULTISPECIES: acyl-CoA thioesterase [Achromobacter]|uniref:Uncharacterized protein n=2 Tax=Achromobacter piechaudii TaxID=72556 RepID=A0A6S7EN87_9BURK|nr:MULTISPECIES: acyl-CoA thioesterase [Achromobacter]EFF76004.1 acyl-CoA thioester hydrolase, YbgC/YbaW family [Achromobacter piechaudii ATCC 43553]KNY10634.1 thioesterase [Achromobacter piechaudii]MPS79284.1 acyl-CoA thioesterase [Achromobacter sp.]CAB3727233.1 hypothetical protein LMG1873_04471 [Achromobacter piechaudii]CAB3902171.1 hypothetical protein LMG2828_04556 [Achromobacter piechaudii]